MLIECPECKKQISDKAETCPNCGFPIRQININNYCIINGKSYNLEEIVELLPKVGEKDTDISPIYLIGCIHRKTQLDWEYSKKLVDIIIETQKIPEKFDGKIELKIELPPNTPKCPTCNSTRLKKISTASKAVNTLAFGLLGTKRNKTYHCNNCGYEW